MKERGGRQRGELFKEMEMERERIEREGEREREKARGKKTRKAGK